MAGKIYIEGFFRVCTASASWFLSCEYGYLMRFCETFLIVGRGPLNDSTLLSSSPARFLEATGCRFSCELQSTLTFCPPGIRRRP